VTAGVLDVLSAAGIAPRLVTTSPARVTVHVAADLVEDALRELHAALVLAEPVTPPDGSVLEVGIRADLAVAA
jgi:hypothetical protein